MTAPNLGADTPSDHKVRPRIFVASASEAKEVAFALQQALEPAHLVTVWPQNVFGLSGYALPSLIERSAESDFAIMVVGRDEVRLKQDGTRVFVPNSNVLIELGLFVGKLDLRRVYLVMPAAGSSKVEMPSDLHGLTTADYEADREDKNIDAAVGPAARKISLAIKERWPEIELRRSRVAKVRFFEEYQADFDRLVSQTTSLEVCFIHSRRWRENHGETLRRRMRNGDVKAATFYLPDVRDAAFLNGLIQRFSDGPAIPGLVYDALKWVLDTDAGARCAVKVRVFSKLPSYTFYRFDSEAVLALYPLSIMKKPVPCIHVNTLTAVGDFLMRDVRDFDRECTSLSRLQLTTLCRSFAGSGHF